MLRFRLKKFARLADTSVTPTIFLRRPPIVSLSFTNLEFISLSFYLKKPILSAFANFYNI